ncbi:MAG TPA: hypothetical protein VGM23_02040 [Armatimonadota bacterium]|jgi:hypothetical protein
MIELTNTLFQPLTLQATCGTGIHLAPRGRAVIPDAEVSEEMRRAARRGFIRLLPVIAAVPVEPLPDDAASKSGKRKEG